MLVQCEGCYPAFGRAMDDGMTELDDAYYDDKLIGTKTIALNKYAR